MGCANAAADDPSDRATRPPDTGFAREEKQVLFGIQDTRSVGGLV